MSACSDFMGIFLPLAEQLHQCIERETVSEPYSLHEKIAHLKTLSQTVFAKPVSIDDLTHAKKIAGLLPILQESLHFLEHFGLSRTTFFAFARFPDRMEPAVDALLGLLTRSHSASSLCEAAQKIISLTTIQRIDRQHILFRSIDFSKQHPDYTNEIVLRLVKQKTPLALVMDADGIVTPSQLLYLLKHNLNHLAVLHLAPTFGISVSESEKQAVFGCLMAAPKLVDIGSLFSEDGEIRKQLDAKIASNKEVAPASLPQVLSRAEGEHTTTGACVEYKSVSLGR